MCGCPRSAAWRAGGKKVLTTGSTGDYLDLAWSPTGDETWFVARQGRNNDLVAVALSRSRPSAGFSR